MMQNKEITKTTLNIKQAYPCTTEILKRVADQFGWEVTTEDREERSGEQLIYWGDVQKIDYVNKQFFDKPGSFIINYFHGFVAVEKKIDHAIALRTMTLLFSKHFDFFLKTWIYPQEYKSLSLETLLNEKEIDGGFPRFIFKPDEESRANGIELFEDTVYIFDKVGAKAGVIQTYLNNPLLWDGYKFDIRSHFVVTSLQPLQIYYSPRTMIRVCTEKFGSTSKQKKMQHITNICFNVSNTEDETSFTRDESELQEMLNQKGYKWA
uniref:Uncharacterized protein n=1 Tax=Ciona savignyi TaxID=51511 RepID=H2ZN25_CIOSA